MDKASAYRLGVSLLTLTLVFIGVQILDWAPDVRAQVTAASSAELAWLPNPSPALAPADPFLIQTWGTTISVPGIYQLAADLSGTTGTAVIVASGNVTILGNGKTIRGDGNFTESTNKETGISIGNNSNVIINGVRFAQLDTAIQATNTSPVQGNTISNVGVDTSGSGFRWSNQSTVQDITFNYVTLNYVRDYAIYWYNTASTTRSEGVWITNSRIQNTGKSGGTGYGVYFSNRGVAQNTSITSDTFTGNKKDIVAYSYSDTTRNLNMSNNLFQSSGQPIYVVSSQ
jgi:hypothetical protein